MSLWIESGARMDFSTGTRKLTKIYQRKVEYGSSQSFNHRLNSLAKNTFDFCFAVVALCFFAPLMLVIAVLILVLNGRPIFYSQWRVGKGGRLFRCFKFRTMVPNSDQVLTDLLSSDHAAQEEWMATQKLAIDPRISSLGRFLRKTSFDELPQFWNVIKGDMSIVGPRPIVTSEIWRYGQFFEDYTAIRPGITGLWQISGRSDTTYAHRVSLDCEYVANHSFFWDLSIILKTVKVVLKRDGAC